jgi:hypothetical protein
LEWGQSNLPPSCIKEKEMGKKLGKRTAEYLAINKKRGLGNGYTISTFVSKTIGYSRYVDVYRYRIYVDLDKHQDKVFCFISVKGGEAYYPKSMLKGEIKKKYETVLAMKKMNPALSLHDLAKKMKLY